MFRNDGDIFYRKKAMHCEDRDLWMRMISGGKKLVVSSKIVLYYRVHGGSLSSTNSKTQKALIDQVIRWHKQRLKTGKDDYDSFEVASLVKNEGDVEKKNQQRKIKSIFLSDLPSNEVSTAIKSYWQQRGFFSWKLSIFLYLICSAPQSLSTMIREKIRKNWE